MGRSTKPFRTIVVGGARNREAITSTAVMLASGLSGLGLATTYVRIVQREDTRLEWCFMRRVPFSSHYTQETKDWTNGWPGVMSVLRPDIVVIDTLAGRDQPSWRGFADLVLIPMPPRTRDVRFGTDCFLALDAGSEPGPLGAKPWLVGLDWRDGSAPQLREDLAARVAGRIPCVSQAEFERMCHGDRFRLAPEIQGAGSALAEGVLRIVTPGG